LCLLPQAGRELVYRWLFPTGEGPAGHTAQALLQILKRREVDMRTVVNDEAKLFAKQVKPGNGRVFDVSQNREEGARIEGEIPGTEGPSLGKERILDLLDGHEVLTGED
jgi:hypothetical protein